MTNSDDVTTSPASPTVRLPLAEAASRLGLHPAALRSRIRRGAATATRGNDGRLLVEVATNADVRHDLATTGPPSPNEELLAELDHLRAQLLTATTAAARAEERAAAVRELADRLTAELLEARREMAELRRPWFRRLFSRD